VGRGGLEQLEQRVELPILRAEVLLQVGHLQLQARDVLHKRLVLSSPTSSSSAATTATTAADEASKQAGLGGGAAGFQKLLRRRLQVPPPPTCALAALALTRQFGFAGSSRIRSARRSQFDLRTRSLDSVGIVTGRKIHVWKRERAKGSASTARKLR